MSDIIMSIATWLTTSHTVSFTGIGWICVVGATVIVFCVIIGFLLNLILSLFVPRFW